MPAELQFVSTEECVCVCVPVCMRVCMNVHAHVHCMYTVDECEQMEARKLGGMEKRSNLYTHFCMMNLY